MNKIPLGKKTELPNLRTVWPDEAQDFTPWLAEDENISILAETLGLEITVDETEAPVGDFNVDILATETETNNRIIIENQLEETNHDHLGKLITYASGTNAKVIIWVVKHVREEHKAAIEWLNNHTDSDIGFFLCEIKLIKVDDSAPAPQFDIIQKPNDWSKNVKNNLTLNETEKKRIEYWNAFKKYASNKSKFMKLFRFRQTPQSHYYNFSIGVSGIHISVLQIKRNHQLGVMLYITDNKDLYANLFKDKTHIEQTIGLGPLVWKDDQTNKSCFIEMLKNVDYDDQNDWNNQFDWIIDVMIKFKNTFGKYLRA